MIAGIKIWHFGFVVLALLLGIAGLVAAYSRSRMQVRGTSQRRSIWDYLLIWPLLFGSASIEDKAKRGGRPLTNRELLGWIAVAVLIVLAIIFHW